METAILETTNVDAGEITTSVDVADDTPTVDAAVANVSEVDETTETDARFNLDESAADIETYLKDEKPEVAAAVRDWMVKTESLYGQGDVSKAPAYVAHAYAFKDLMILHAVEKGDAYKRSGFMSDMASIIKKTSTIPDGSCNVHALAKAVGFCELVRSTIEPGSESRSFPNSVPDADFFGGCFTWPALLAMATMVRIDKKSGIDTYEWEVNGCAEIAKDLMHKLRNKLMPSSRRFVEHAVAASVARLKKSIKDNARKGLSPDQQALADAAEANAIRDKKEAAFLSTMSKLVEQALELGMDGDNLRGHLERAKLIPQLTTEDAKKVISTDPSARRAISSALASSEITAQEFVTLTGASGNRANAMKALAQICTHQDIAVFFGELTSLYRSTPIPTRDIPGLVNQIGARAADFCKLLIGSKKAS